MLLIFTGTGLKKKKAKDWNTKGGLLKMRGDIRETSKDE